ncbi:MAG TPA: hypothetical protein PKI61_00895 [bacterium]|nr:hypothetical protein [bacterium]HPT29360.1 hypothetical protein [bacterium]
MDAKFPSEPIHLGSGEHQGKIKVGSIIKTAIPGMPIGMWRKGGARDYNALLLMFNQLIPGTEIVTGVFKAVPYDGRGLFFSAWRGQALPCFLDFPNDVPCVPQVNEVILITKVFPTIVRGKIIPCPKQFR